MPKSSYNFEIDLEPITKGQVPVPNFEPMDPNQLLSNIASGGHSMRAQWGWASFDGRKDWAQFFLTGVGMGSPPTVYGGGGYVIAYNRRTPRVGTFAICRHSIQDGPGADHKRGWHPGRCSKCGINMTVDSGD